MRLSNLFIESIEHGSGALRFGRNAMVHQNGPRWWYASHLDRIWIPMSPPRLESADPSVGAHRSLRHRS